MTKQELIRDMKQFVKEERISRAKSNQSESKSPSSFITQAAIMRYWGRSKAKVLDLLDGLEYDDTGRDYKYFIPDVAERLKDRMTTRS